MQVRVIGVLPGVTATERLAVEATARLTVPPVAVKGPKVDAVAGKESGIPADGTGLGIGALKLMVPLGMLAGVAPVASTADDAVPVMAVLPNAADAVAMSGGRLTWVW